MRQRLPRCPNPWKAAVCCSGGRGVEAGQKRTLLPMEKCQRWLWGSGKWLWRKSSLLANMPQHCVPCVSAWSFSFGKRGLPQLPRQTLGPQTMLQCCCSAHICREFDHSCEEKPDVWPRRPWRATLHFAVSQIDRWVFCLIQSYFTRSGPQLVGYWGWHRQGRKTSSPSAQGCERWDCPSKLQIKAIERQWCPEMESGGRSPGVKGTKKNQGCREREEAGEVLGDQADLQHHCSTSAWPQQLCPCPRGELHPCSQHCTPGWATSVHHSTSPKNGRFHASNLQLGL